MWCLAICDDEADPRDQVLYDSEERANEDCATFNLGSRRFQVFPLEVRGDDSPRPIVTQHLILTRGFDGEFSERLLPLVSWDGWVTETSSQVVEGYVAVSGTDHEAVRALFAELTSTI